VGRRRDGRPDADLVRAALGGDREPLGELVLRHWTTAACLAARVLGSADLGHEAAQEAAVAAMTNLDRLRTPDRFGAWFCGIALNVARRWLRQLRAEVPALLPDQASSLPGPAEAAEIADLAWRVRRAVDQLPNGQREAVLLFYLQGLSQLEVAGELGISRGAVKARLHQARAALAPRLAPMIDTRKEPAMTTSGQTGNDPTRNGTAGKDAAHADQARWVEAEVREVRRSQGDDPRRRKHIMILAERGGERMLPIWIGPGEATALALTLTSTEMPRPFTYQLAAGLVSAAGSAITEVRITRLVPPVFYASVLVTGPGGPREVDSRPSDAVNLALVAGVPIRVDSALLGLDQPAEHAAEMVALSDSTSDIVAEAQQIMREERRWTRQAGNESPPT
jgi:RNA polymerase sigma factor (sigma-70 family)